MNLKSRSRIVPLEVVTSVVNELLCHSSSTSPPTISTSVGPDNPNVKQLHLPTYAELDMHSPPNKLAPSAKNAPRKRYRDSEACTNQDAGLKVTRKRRKSLEISKEYYPPNRVCNSRLPIPGYAKSVLPECTSPSNSLEYTYSPTPSSSSNGEIGMDANYSLSDHIVTHPFGYPKHLPSLYSLQTHHPYQQHPYDPYFMNNPTDVSHSYQPVNYMFALPELQPFISPPQNLHVDSRHKHYINM